MTTNSDLYAILDLGYVSGRKRRRHHRRAVSRWRGPPPAPRQKPRPRHHPARRGNPHPALPRGGRPIHPQRSSRSSPRNSARTASTSARTTARSPQPAPLIGPGKLIGRSTHSLDQARAALAEGFDYIGFGPLFPPPPRPAGPPSGCRTSPPWNAKSARTSPPSASAASSAPISPKCLPPAPAAS